MPSTDIGKDIVFYMLCCAHSLAGLSSSSPTRIGLTTLLALTSPPGTRTPRRSFQGSSERGLHDDRRGLYSSDAKHQSCKVKVWGSIPSGGFRFCRSRLSWADRGSDRTTRFRYGCSCLRCVGSTSLSKLAARPPPRTHIAQPSLSSPL